MRRVNRTTVVVEVSDCSAISPIGRPANASGSASSASAMRRSAGRSVGSSARTSMSTVRDPGRPLRGFMFCAFVGAGGVIASLLSRVPPPGTKVTRQ
jgi:hypothetical protein